MNEIEFSGIIYHAIKKNPEWLNSALSAATSGMQAALQKERERSTTYSTIALSTLNAAYGKRAHKDFTEMTDFNLRKACEQVFPKEHYPHLWGDKARATDTAKGGSK